MKLDPKSFGCGLAVGVGAGLAIGLLLLFGAAWFMNVREEKESEWLRVSATNFCPVVGDELVTQALKPIRNKFNVPAIAAVVVTSEGIEGSGAVGVRKRDTEVAVTLDDQWHLGSDCKAMTATLLARFVERGQLKWETTVADLFPDLADQMHPDFKGVTLQHLLSHRAGLRANLQLGDFLGDDVRSLRLRAVREQLAKKPRYPPGREFEYSNLGYIIAGAVVERLTSNTWERAISDEIFTPLQMKSVGFGGTGTSGQIDQPWPHAASGEPVLENGLAMDNPPVMGPAGRVHCTIQDWAKFIQDQLRGHRGESALLKPESYRTLHTPPFGGDYALGWITVERSWGGGMVLNHGGDNTMNYANVWVAPQKNFAVLVCVNQSGDRAFRATDEAVNALIKLHNTKSLSK